MSAAGSRREASRTGCWYDRVEAGLAASIDGESRFEPRGRAHGTFDFDAAGSSGWTGDGFELGNDGASTTPEQPALPLEAAARLEPGRASRRRPSPIRRRRWRRRSRARRGRAARRAPSARSARRRAALAARPAGARPAAAICPTCPPRTRAAAARRFLAQPAHGLTAEEQRDMGRRDAGGHRAPGYRRAVRPRLARRGAVGRHGDAPRGTFTVSGQIDRLAVTADRVLIVDYKTIRPPPATDDGRGAAPIAASSRSIARCSRGSIPAARCAAFLLWTAAPRLMEIDAETLDGSMPYAARILTRPTAFLASRQGRRRSIDRHYTVFGRTRP